MKPPCRKEAAWRGDAGPRQQPKACNPSTTWWQSSHTWCAGCIENLVDPLYMH